MVSNSDNRSVESYRTSHQAQGYGDRYTRTYEIGYYAAQWELVEKPLLRSAINRYCSYRRSCLDFACGTGRISLVLAELFQEVTAVDVSAEMLKRANVPSNVVLVHRDLTYEPLKERFDCATAFRFFLNAEDDLRTMAIQAVWSHLKDGAPLICNIHMSASSPMGVVYRSLGALGYSVHKVWARSAFVSFLEAAGFRVEHVIEYGFLPRPGRFLPRLCERLVLPVERVSKALRMPACIAQSFLVVARKRA